MNHKSLMIECDMLEGNINRMMVTKELKELVAMRDWAIERIDRIYKARREELMEVKDE